MEALCDCSPLTMTLTVAGTLSIILGVIIAESASLIQKDSSGWELVRNLIKITGAIIFVIGLILVGAPILYHCLT